jgi:hypothetical protein
VVHKSTHLVSTFVSHQNYKRAMVLFNIIVDEDRNARVELLSHLRRVWRLRAANIIQQNS